MAELASQSHLKLIWHCFLDASMNDISKSSHRPGAESTLKYMLEKWLTSLLGTQIGVPSFTIPASTITPITIGSRELKINCGRILKIKFDDNAKKIIRNLTTMPKNILEDQNKLLNELKFSLKKCYKLFLKSVRCKQKVFIHEFHENSLWGKIFHYQFNHCHLHLRRGTEFFFTFFVFYPGYSDFLKHVYLVYCVLFRKRIRIQWPSFRAFFR